MDTRKLVGDVIRIMRGRRSQLNLSLRLGYCGNQLYRWESGQREIAWSEFLRVGKACRLNVLESLKTYFGPGARIHAPRELVKFLIADSTLVALATKTKISRQALARWIIGASEPSAAEVFTLLHECQHILYEFLQTLLGSHDLTHFDPQFAQRKAEKEIYYQYPWVDAVLCCLELSAYRRLKHHREGWIARHLQITLNEEKAALQSLLQVKAIHVSANKYVLSAQRPHLSGDFEGGRKIRSYWFRQAVRRIESDEYDQEVNSLRCSLYSVSQEMAEKLRAEQNEYFFRIRSIINQPVGELDRILALDFMAFSVVKSEPLGTDP